MADLIRQGTTDVCLVYDALLNNGSRLFGLQPAAAPKDVGPTASLFRKKNVKFDDEPSEELQVSGAPMYARTEAQNIEPLLLAEAAHENVAGQSGLDPSLQTGDLSWMVKDAPQPELSGTCMKKSCTLYRELFYLH